MEVHGRRLRSPLRSRAPPGLRQADVTQQGQGRRQRRGGWTAPRRRLRACPGTPRWRQRAPTSASRSRCGLSPPRLPPHPLQRRRRHRLRLRCGGGRPQRLRCRAASRLRDNLCIISLVPSHSLWSWGAPEAHRCRRRRQFRREQAARTASHADPARALLPAPEPKHQYRCRWQNSRRQGRDCPAQPPAAAAGSEDVKTKARATCG